MMPRAREDGLVVQELPDEILVYDLSRHRAYCLNRTAAMVWRHCDGQTTIAEMAALLENELKIPADEKIVWMALDRLERAHLLKERVGLPEEAARCSRREVLRTLGLVGGLALLLPVVSSIITPTAAQVVTCVTSCAGQPDCVPCGPPNCDKRCRRGRCVGRPASGCP